MYKEYANHDVAVYAGYLTDDAELLQCSSGGIATALSKHMLANNVIRGGYVAGVSYGKDFHNAEYILIHDESELDKLKGSKYIECDKNNIYSEVKKLINDGERVLFFGLPCTVATLYKYIGSRPENLLTCELICHGATSAKIHRDYVAYLENKYKSKIVNFSVRYKKKGWMPLYLHAEFANGKVFEKPFYDTEYAFGFSTWGRKSCYSCKFKGNNRCGDIMIGDFWGATEKDEFWNKNGVSSVFAETEKGNEFLKSVPGIKLFPTTFERAVEKNPMVIKSKTKKGNCDKFSALLKEKGLMYAAKHSVGLKTRIARKIPNSFIRILKKVVK